MMEGMDRFTAEAYAMVTGPAARRAFVGERDDTGIARRDRGGRIGRSRGHASGRRAAVAGRAATG